MAFDRLFVASCAVWDALATGLGAAPARHLAGCFEAIIFPVVFGAFLPCFRAAPACFALLFCVSPFFLCFAMSSRVWSYRLDVGPLLSVYPAPLLSYEPPTRTRFTPAARAFFLQCRGRHLYLSPYPARSTDPGFSNVQSSAHRTDHDLSRDHLDAI